MLVRAETKHGVVQRSIGIYLVTGLTPARLRHAGRAPGLTDGCFKLTIQFFHPFSKKVLKKIQSVRPETVRPVTK